MPATWRGHFCLQAPRLVSALPARSPALDHRLPADYWETYPPKSRLFTADDIQRIARKFLNAIAVGDGSKIKSVLEKYGIVEVYDTQGKAKSGRDPQVPPALLGG